MRRMRFCQPYRHGHTEAFQLAAGVTDLLTSAIICIQPSARVWYGDDRGMATDGLGQEE